MADVLRQLYREVTSQTGAAVQSPPARIDGNDFEFRFDAGAAHTGTPPAVTVQISHDKFNWNTALLRGTTGSNASSAAENDYLSIREPAKWARFQVASDSEGARIYQGTFIVHKVE